MSIQLCNPGIQTNEFHTNIALPLWYKLINTYTIYLISINILQILKIQTRNKLI